MLLLQLPGVLLPKVRRPSWLAPKISEPLSWFFNVFFFLWLSSYLLFASFFISSHIIGINHANVLCQQTLDLC